MVKRVFASVRRLNFVQKEMMTQEIYKYVGEIYGHISAVNQAERLANMLIEEDNKLRQTGSEEKYLDTLEKMRERLSKEINTLSSKMESYITVVGVYDMIHLYETKKLIGKVQREMPDKLVSPMKLSGLVLDKVESTDIIMKKVRAAEHDWKAKVQKKKDQNDL